MTFTIHDKGLSTMIDWRNRDSFGREISSKNRAQLYRLRKWQRRIRVSNATERNLAFALAELDRMASALGLPRNIRERSALVYRNAVDKNLIRGRSIEGVAAALLYAACRQCSLPRTLDEIAEVSRVSRKEIGRTYRFVSRQLGLKILSTSPIDYVPRFCYGSRSKEKCRAVRSRSSGRLGNASSQAAGARPGLQRPQFICRQSLVENGAPSAKWQKLPVSRSYPQEQVQGTGRETRY